MHASARDDYNVRVENQNIELSLLAVFVGHVRTLAILTSCSYDSLLECVCRERKHELFLIQDVALGDYRILSAVCRATTIEPRPPSTVLTEGVSRASFIHSCIRYKSNTLLPIYFVIPYYFQFIVVHLNISTNRKYLY